MKKKRLTGFLAIASCVMLLTGCESEALFGLGGVWNGIVDWGKGVLGIKDEDKGGDEGEKPAPTPTPTPDPDPEVDPKPNVTLTVGNIPEFVMTGKSLDLANYVTVRGTNEPFAVSISQESAQYAKVEGQKINAIGEGVIDFTISVADKSESRSIESMDKERYELLKAYSNVGQEYSIYEVNSSGALEWSAIHDENFYLSYYWDVDYEAKKYLPGGFMTFGSDEVLYDFSYDDNTKAFNVSHKQRSYEYMEYYNSPFSFDFRNLEYNTIQYYNNNDELVERSAYSLFGEECREFTKEVLGDDDVSLYIDDAHTKSATFDFEICDFSLVNISSGSTANYALEMDVWIDFYPEAKQEDEPFWALLSIYVLAKGVDSDFASLEEFAANPENTPEPLKLAEKYNLPTTFDYVKTSAEDDNGASIDFFYGWTNNDQPVEVSEEQWEEYGMSDYIFPNFQCGSFAQTMSSNLIASFSLEGQKYNYISGAAKVGDDIFDVEYDATRQEYHKYPTSFESLYDSEAYALNELAEESFWDDNLFYGEKTVEGEGTYLYMNYYLAEEIFTFICSFSDGATLLANLLLEREFLEVFDCYIFLDASNNFVSVCFEMDYLELAYEIPLTYKFEFKVNMSDTHADLNAEYYSIVEALD